MSDVDYTIILFYNYTYISDPGQLMRDQRELCERLNIKGRTIVAHEGINGTYEGKTEDIDKFWKEFTSDSRFANTHLKRSSGNGNAFPKLSIKVRVEIVSLNLGDEDFSPNDTTATHLSPEKLHEWIQNGEEFEIVDMRNDYEHRIGRFKGSHLPKMKNFRDLPEAMDKLEPIKNKKVLTVCTGGIRCEKASGYLIKKGFGDVYQLDGGIVSYMEKYPNQDFEGKLFVFDKRLSMGFETDSSDHKVISNCDKCDSVSDNYRDCGFPQCHSLFICCTICLEDSGEAFCSNECKAKATKRVEV